MPRIFIAGLFHETHCFVDDSTGLDRFEVRRGGEMRECLGDASPLGGVLEFASGKHWEMIPAADYRALPSGMVSDEVVEAFWSDFSGAWQENLDAIYLVLHGAMVARSFPDVEGEILRRIRSLPGASGLPLFAVYDLHANISEAMCEHADALVAYRENPHTDAREAAVRAAQLLDRCIESGKIPSIALRQTGMVWTPGKTGTAADPMASLEMVARRVEEENPDIWAVNIAAGFSYADTPDTGVSFQVVGMAGKNEMQAILDELESLARRLDATESGVAEISPEEAIRLLQKEPVDGLTVLVEPSDNIGGGAPGDMTGLFRALLEAKVGNAALCLHDPLSVSRLLDLEPGDKRELSLGGKGSQLDEGPVLLEVELVGKSDGRFHLEDSQSHLASLSGNIFDMGPSAVVRHDGLTILLTSVRTPPFDLGQWRSQGIDPESLDVIVVKAAVAHRRVYDPVAARMLWVDTPGPCTSRLDRLPYQHRKMAIAAE